MVPPCNEDLTQRGQWVGWRHVGLDPHGGGLHVVLVLVVKPLLAGLVSVAGPHVKLALSGRPRTVSARSGNSMELS